MKNDPRTDIDDGNELKPKTFKDLQGTYYIFRDDLKAEAIKWVKEDKGQIKVDVNLPQQTRILLNYLTTKWMKRLNITEDELK